MSSGSERRPEQLRLAAARRRLDAFLAEVERLQSGNFPHRDSRDALDNIHEIFTATRREIAIDPDCATKDTINTICADISFLVEQYTGVLGFILRSTNVRNPFELHYPLKRVVTETIGPESRLIISSEWDFIPFTYPMTLDLLEGFVLVGSPAPESGNVLLAPLAGHEIGHSAWRKSPMSTDLEDQISAAVESELNALPAEKKDLFSELKLGELGFDLIKQDCTAYAILQLEEIFCDLFGLRLFEDSYVYAFEYFMAPGGEDVSLEYPSSSRRMEIIQARCSELGIQVPEPHFGEWLTSRSDSARELILVDVVDRACRPFIRDLASEASSFIDASIARLRRPIVKNIVDAFTHSEPYRELASIAEIVTAGWIIVTSDNATLLAAKEFRVLNDLMLKTIEVSEYLRK